MIVPAGIIEEAPKSGKARPYTEHLSRMAGAGEIPAAPQGESTRCLWANSSSSMFLLGSSADFLFLFSTGYSQREAPTIEGMSAQVLLCKPQFLEF